MINIIQNFKKNLLSVSLILLAGVNYGLIFPLNSMAIHAHASYFGHAFWQTIISGLLLLLIVMYIREPFRLTFEYIRVYFLVGVFAFSIPMSVLTLVSSQIPVGMTSLVMGLSPTLTYILGMLVKLERPSLIGILGIMLGFVGLIILLLPELFLPSSEILIWFAIALITPVCLAIANISASFYNPRDSSPISMGAGFLLAGAVSIFPLTFYFNQFYWPIGTNLIIPTFGASMVNIVHIVLFATIVKNYGAVFFSQFNYIVIIFAMLWAFIIFDETPSSSIILPLVLMTLGIVLSSLRK
ncbi:MAG: DMT family transporter [Paracoccaceae bacterium]|nr:DMT family transporter [Paracoccaceae bacterium]